jgi:GntR family transcriptional regulator / MocR family aminotransferase
MRRSYPPPHPPVVVLHHVRVREVRVPMPLAPIATLRILLLTAPRPSDHRSLHRRGRPSHFLLLLVAVSGAFLTLGAADVPVRSNDVVETQTNLAWGTLFDLSATRPGPLHMRLAAAIRSAIRDGRVPRGAALPPSRQLADDLGISRSTVTHAYGQLVTEGYLSARTGSGTRVSWTPDPDDDVALRLARQPAAVPSSPARFDMYACWPDRRAFPRRKWVAAITAAATSAPFDQLGYSEPGGMLELRTVLAEHLNRSRGAVVDPATISIFSGAGQALVQVCRALVADGETVLGIEDPGSPRYWEAARTAGIELVGLPVDEQGLIVEALDRHTELRAVCVGTARQMAYGTPLPPDRRQQLLDWTHRTGGLLIEDDYDHEFSYDRPVPAVLQGKDPRRVALMGSMSQALGPTVSIGWVVTPGRLVQAVRAEDEIQALPPTLNQLALAHLMRSGGYDRHVRTIRLQLRRRRNLLVAELQGQLPEYRVHGAQSGMMLLLELPPGTDTASLISAAARRGLHIGDIEEMRLRPDAAKPGLLLGYGNLDDKVIPEAVAILADLIGQAAGASVA